MYAFCVMITLKHNTITTHNLKGKGEVVPVHMTKAYGEVEV